MKKINPKKNKHLTGEDRKEIEECLGKGMAFKHIARHIGKDPTTVSYEVKHHRIEYRNSYTRTDEPCSKLLKAPFVCNGCEKKPLKSCPYVRYIYRSASAQDEYRTLLSEAREGIPLNKESFYEDDRIITSGLQRGQHIYHIQVNNPLHSSKSTIYRHFHKGYYSASLIDLPRAVKFKPRNQHHDAYVPSALKVGRTYDDFQVFLEANHIVDYLQTDTVIGRIGGKTIQTMIFTDCNFMVGLLLDNKTAAEAAEKFSALKNKLRSEGFPPATLFPVVLADNGGEFSDVFSFENDPDGKQELHLFFCDPMQSCQKPQVEKNHTLFRDIVPKGKSFDDFSQETVNLIFSHVNSVSRSIYHGKSAFDMFSFIYGEKLASLLGISRIPPNQVCQSPMLLDGIADLNKNL